MRYLPRWLKKDRRPRVGYKRWTLCRESIDARNKSDIKRVYSVDFEIEEKHLDKK